MQHERHGLLYVSTDAEIEANEKRGWKTIDKHPNDKSDKAAPAAGQKLTAAQVALSKKAADLAAKGNMTELIALAGTVGVSVETTESKWSAERIQQAIAATFGTSLLKRAAKLYEDGDRAGLLALAEASGVKVDQRWTESRIRDAIVDADEPEEPETPAEPKGPKGK
jgi:hypothetical protein